MEKKTNKTITDLLITEESVRRDILLLNISELNVNKTLTLFLQIEDQNNVT